MKYVPKFGVRMDTYEFIVKENSKNVEFKSLIEYMEFE